MWGQVKDEISAYRSGSADSSRLLSLSEDFFEQANHTVFSADAYSARQMRFLLTGCLVMMGVMSLTWIFISVSYTHLDVYKRQVIWFIPLAIK